MHKRQVSLRRQLTDYFFTGLAAGLSVVVVGALLAIFFYLAFKGVGSLNLSFFTQTPKPVGEPGGGMANAIVGSMIILAIASLFGVPIGIGAGVYLAEYGRGRFGDLVRFTADTLNGVPSIVIGLVAYGLVVIPQGHFSAFAAGVALAMMMVPTITRATEEMLLLVPQAVREAAFGLGIPQWRTTVSITLATARSGIITGVMLAFARVAGETAPLMFTALGNQFWSLSTTGPIGALPLQIFTYATSPFEDWIRQAWAGALVLVIFIVGTTTLVRFVFLRRMLGGAR
jgi:phosphate transport system permease protein